MNKRTALIAGATGLVGGYCLKALLEEEIYEKVIVLNRKNVNYNHPKISEKVVDFNHLGSYPDIKADDVFCCLGTTMKVAGSKEAFRKVDFEYPISIAKLSLVEGASQFNVISSMGADADSMIFYNKVKGEMEAEILSLAFQSVNILRPSLLLGPRKEFRLGEKIAGKVMQSLEFLFMGPMKKHKPIQALTVGYGLVKAATQNRSGNKIILSEEIEKLFS